MKQSIENIKKESFLPLDDWQIHYIISELKEKGADGEVLLGLAMREMPISAKQFERLCGFLSDEIEAQNPSDCEKSLLYIRNAKLPKKRIYSWLRAHGIYSDLDVLTKLWIPIVRKKEGAWTVGDSQDYECAAGGLGMETK